MPIQNESNSEVLGGSCSAALSLIRSITLDKQVFRLGRTAALSYD